MDLKSKEVLQEALHLRISLVSVLTVLRIAICRLKSYQFFGRRKFRLLFSLLL